LTPGGPRPLSQTQRVGPGEVVTRAGGTSQVIGVTAHTRAAADLNRSKGLVLTPGGFRHPSLVHRLERGQAVTRAGGVSRKLDLATGTATDLPSTSIEPAAVAIPALGSGWITDALFAGTPTLPVSFSFFTTTWKVPPAPTSQDGQTIFLFNALLDSLQNDILQPVLQWGPSQAGGGNSWAVACWYIDPSGKAFYHDLVSVNQGDILVGVMKLTGQSGGTFNYDCSFQGIDGADLTVQSITTRTVATETLECYSVQNCADYPDAFYTAMTAIELQTSGADIQPNWGVENRVTDCGQHTILISTASPGGEVDLFYSSRAPHWNLQKLTGGTARTSGPVAITAPFVSVFGQQEHVSYRDSGGTIWDSWYDGGSNSWNLQRINGSSGVTSGPTAAQGPFVWVYNQQQHFTYLDSSGTIWDSWYDGGNGSWTLQQNNAGGLTSGPPAVGDAFASVFAQQQHLAYRDGSGTIWDAWYDSGSNRWSLQQINAGGLTNGNPAAAGPFVSVFGEQQHFVYVDRVGTIWDSWYDAGRNLWSLQQINSGGLTGGPAAASGPFVSVYNQQQHFAYADGAGTIWDSWYDGGSNRWSLQQINAGGLTNGPAAADGVFVCVYNQQQHFAYKDATGTVWDSWYDGSDNSWNLQQINLGNSGNQGVTTGAVAAGNPFVWVYNQQQHFTYRGVDEAIWDAWYQG
jgi:hypothetical protein